MKESERETQSEKLLKLDEVTNAVPYVIKTRERERERKRKRKSDEDREREREL